MQLAANSREEAVTWLLGVQAALPAARRRWSVGRLMWLMMKLMMEEDARRNGHRPAQAVLAAVQQVVADRALVGDRAPPGSGADP